MIRIGNQTAFSAARLLDPFEFALANRFDAFEWFPDKKPSGAGWDETDLGPDLRRGIRAAARRHDVRLSVHACCQANPLDPAAWPRLQADLDLARDLGASLLNVHLDVSQGMAAYVAALEPLVQATAAQGLQLTIENTVFTGPEHFNELFDRLSTLRQVPTAHVGMCLDIGHANLWAGTRNDYLGFVSRLAARVPIRHLHLHENWGDADTHLPLFTGPAACDPSGVFQLCEHLRQRRYRGAIILEQWPHPPALLSYARDRLKEILALPPAPVPP